MSGYYPILLNLTGRMCVIVGGGAVAARKATALLDAGAKVKLVSPEVSDAVREMADNRRIEWIAAPFSPETLNGAALVIASTDSQEVNRRVYDETQKSGIPVNIVDQPGLCTFIVPSVVRRGDLVIAISTSGKSPAVSKRIRQRLEEEFGDEWGEYLEIMGQAREKTISSVGNQKEREKIFHKLAGSDLLEKIKGGDIEGARRLAGEIVGS